MIQHHNLWSLVMEVVMVSGHTSVQMVIFQLRCVQLCGMQIREVVGVSPIQNDSEHKNEASVVMSG